MKLICGRPDCIRDLLHTLCPGCGYGIIMRIVGEVVDEMGMREDIIMVNTHSCFNQVALWNGGHYVADYVRTNHGRSPAVATGLKRVQPDKLVVTFQGDGDISAIGIAEALHAAGRGEKFTILFLNNANFGDTGGHMSPTTLLGQRTKTTPMGRKAELHGYPVPITEMIAMQAGSAYVARVSVHKPAEVNRAKRAIRRAFETQMAGLGFSMVEILSQCPGAWALSPVQALEFVEQRLVPAYPLKELKVPAKAVEAAAPLPETA